MRHLFPLLFCTACSFPTEDWMHHPPPYNASSTTNESWQEQLSGNWKLIESTEDNPPTTLLALRVYTPAVKFLDCPTMVASIANMHEAQFYSFLDLCFVTDSTISSKLFPFSFDYRVEGTFTFHTSPRTTMCKNNPTRVDCITQDDYYLLTLDLYQSGALTKHRIYRKALPDEEHVSSNHTYVILYDEYQIPYEFFVDSRESTNDISQLCPQSRRVLFSVDSTYSYRIPFEFACVAEDNSFVACPFEDQSYCITGTFTDDMTLIQYRKPDDALHILTQ